MRLRRLEQTDCAITVDGVDRSARAGETVAAALLATGVELGLWCGMGCCHVCAVEIDGRPGRRACMEEVAPGMVVRTRRASSADA